MPIGQPRREKPILEVGISVGRGEVEMSASAGVCKRDFPRLRWSPTVGPSLSTMLRAAAKLAGGLTPSYCEEVLEIRVEKIKESLRVLSDMEDSQLQTTLLRSCLSFPKISYILRTCPPSHILQATRNFDTAISCL